MHMSLSTRYTVIWSCHGKFEAWISPLMSLLSYCALATTLQPRQCVGRSGSDLLRRLVKCQVFCADHILGPICGSLYVPRSHPHYDVVGP